MGYSSHWQLKPGHSCLHDKLLVHMQSSRDLKANSLALQRALSRAKLANTQSMMLQPARQRSGIVHECTWAQEGLNGIGHGQGAR